MIRIARRLVASIGSILCIALTPACSTQPDAFAANGWRALAVSDVDDLYSSVRGIHPGYRDPETPDFAAHVEQAYRSALDNANAAQSYLDWRLATQGFMLAFRDGHTIFRPNVAPTRVRWPGFLIEGRGNGYFIRRPAGVSDVDTDAPEGGRLISCDGVAIEHLLRDQLDEREADWTKAPERIRQAYRLLIDYRMEGKTLLTTCRIVGPTGEMDLQLNWRIEAWSNLAPALAPFNREISRPIASRIAANGAYWIGLGNFGDEGALGRLASELETQTAKLRTAPYIVLDLRGNRGGNSGWGTTLANLLWGEAAVSSAMSRRSASASIRGGKFWRASPEVAAEARRTADQFASMGPDMAGPAQYFRDIAKLIDNTPSGDRALVEDPCCKPEVAPNMAAFVKPVGVGPVYVLTDAACFSSCVLALVPLRAMGSIVVGETTGQNEEYGEIAGPITTPSGLARYFVPMTIIRQDRETLVVSPDRAWGGAMDDDAGIEEWIARMERVPRGADRTDG